MCDSVETGSKATAARPVHSEKEWSSILFTDEGMQINASELQRENAPWEMSEMREGDSNVTVERLVQSLKQ
jgi:hypothetical protein